MKRGENSITAEHWLEHLPILAQRWPLVARALSEVELPADARVTSSTPEQTLVVAGVQLTSAFNRLGEARQQASHLADNASEVTVYGLALGDLPRVLLRRSALQTIRVVLLSRALAKLSFSAVEHRDWLVDERFELELAGPTSTLAYPHVIAPAELRFAERDAFPLRDAIVTALAEPYVAGVFANLHEFLEQRLEENRRRCALDQDVATLFGSRAGTDFVVAAAGPTLPAQFAWLKTERQNFTLIAVNTALPLLCAAGIPVDYVVAIDHGSRLARHFEGLDLARLRSVGLVYTPTVMPSVLAEWPGPRFAAYTAHERYDQLRASVPRANLFCGGTVLHPSVDLAVRMGARSVTLVGADLAYPNNASHADGAAFQKTASSTPGAQLRSDDGLGGSVATDPNLVGYRRDLEAYIAAHPAVRFRKAGRAGAQVSGAEWCDFDVRERGFVHAG